MFLTLWESSQNKNFFPAHYSPQLASRMCRWQSGSTLKDSTMWSNSANNVSLKTESALEIFISFILIDLVSLPCNTITVIIIYHCRDIMDSISKLTVSLQTNWNFLFRARSELLVLSRRGIPPQTSAFRGPRLSMEFPRFKSTMLTLMMRAVTVKMMLMLKMICNSRTCMASFMKCGEREMLK